MPLYVFYPTRPNGLADTFESVSFRSDDEAVLYASKVLIAHESAANVVVYQGQRQVAVAHRDVERRQSAGWAIHGRAADAEDV